MKGVFKFYLLVGCLFLLAGCSFGKTEVPTEDATTSGGQLIVATEAGFAPYEYLRGNEVVGIDIDIATEIASHINRDLIIKNMDFNGALLALQQGKVDMVAAAVSVTDERLEVMDFSKEYVNSTEVVVVNSESPAVSSLDDLDGKIVGVQEGNIADFYVSDKENMDAKDIKRYSTFAQAAEDLKNGKIDCIVMDEYPAQELVKSSNGALSVLDGVLFEDKYAIAVQKGNTELLDSINTVLDKLISEGKIDEFTANHVSQ